MKGGSSFLLLVLLGAASALAVAEPVGMVLDVQGPVQFLKPTTQDVSLFATLEPGAEIALGRGARLVATNYARGTEFSYTGQARLQVKADGIVIVYGSKPTERELLPNQAKAAGDGVARRQQQAAIGLRNVDSGPTPAHQGGVRETTPTFMWEGASEGSWVAVFDREGKRVALFSLSTEARATLPREQALKRGEVYSWTLVDRDGLPLAANRKSFRVLREEEIAMVNEQRPAANASVSQWALYAGLLENLWLHNEAKPIWHRLAQQRPEDATLAKLAH